MDPQQPVAMPPPPPQQQPQQQRPTQPSPVNVTNVVALANPATFASPLDFEITFECTAALPDDLEWRMVYVGSADDSSYDQLLTEVEVGPVPVGVNKFEFLRVGYYVSNEAPEHDVPTAQTVTRTVLAENPRVTRVDIDWLAPKPADAYAAPAFSFS
ncbi:hypothetical protein JL722_9939 [Aureococcus anophagefferens]|nr:hypothetical protein JL722_9939 [Aureococcus anophagefferens]